MFGEKWQVETTTSYTNPHRLGDTHISLLMKSNRFELVVFLFVIVVGAVQLFVSRTSAISPIVNGITLILLLASGIYFFLRIIGSPREITRYTVPTDTFDEQGLDESVFEYSTKRYGVGYLSMLIECVINEDGSATIARRIELIAESDLSSLDTSLLVPTEGDDEWDLERLRLYSTTTDRIVTVVEEMTEFNLQSVRLVFSPPLRPKDETGYILIERLPEEFYSFTNSLKELKEKRKSDDFTGLSDYFGWHINRPTKYLKLKVTFPENWKPRQTESKVLVAKASGFPSTIEQREENRRTKFNLVGPEVGSYRLELEVDYPMIGLIYIMSWQPVFSNEPVVSSENTENDATNTESS